MGFLGKIYQVMRPIKTEKPYIDAELAVDESAIYKRLKLVPYTPDDLLSKKGFKILQKMMEDPEIEGTIDSLLRIRLSSGWEIIAGSESEAGSEQRDFVQWNLDNIDGSFDDDLREIMNGVPLGWSLSELVWYEIDKGKYAGKIGLKALKSRNPKYFNMYTDDFDNVRDYGVVNISSMDYGRGYPRDKFVIYSWQKKYENIFGQSAIRTLYDYYFLKQIFTRAWGIFTEKYGHPFAVIKTPAGIDSETRSSLLNVIRQIRMETGLVIPNTCEMELMEVMSKGTDPFIKGLDWFNTQIRKKILGQDLTGESGKASGSYSLGKVHFDILLMFEEQLGIDIGEKAVNPQIVRRLIDYNYAGTTDYPEFRFKPLVQEDREAIIDKYYEGVKGGILKPIPEDEKVIREYLHMPYRDTTAAVAPIVDAALQRTPAPAVEPVSNTEEFEFAAFADSIITGTKRRKFTRYEEQIDFVEMRSGIEYDTKSSALAAAKVLQDAVKQLIIEIDKKKIMQEQNFAAINKLQLLYVGDLKNIFEQMLVSGFKRGMRDGRQELTSRKKALRFREYRSFAQVDIRNVKPTQAIEYFKQKAFMMAGVERDNVLKKTKQILLDGLKTGATMKDVISEIDTQMLEYIEKSGTAASVIAEGITGGRIETVVRTNLMDALSQGRKAYFEDPALDGYVVAYQYSAILDDRVRPNHACCDGKIFAVENPVWNSIMPPNGYNCRCIVVPITADDAWTEDERGSCCTPDKGFDKPAAI